MRFLRRKQNNAAVIRITAVKARIFAILKTALYFIDFSALMILSIDFFRRHCYNK